ncbi:MAG: HU family DNA-binding protein [Gammaproteobacteria bacterium]|nr:MAG: HU family DNA-binding protein [Gammaproteobacteria bacterium]
MNKSELIQAVADYADIPKTVAARAVDGMIHAITEALSKGEPVTLVGFGTFTVRERAARTGRNPRTGEKLTIPASKAPVFRPGKALKEAVK